MEVWIKQRCVSEFLHVEKMAPIDIHQHLLNVYREQTVDVSIDRQWVVCFSSGDSNMKDKLLSQQPCTAVTPQNEDLLDQLIYTNQLMVLTMSKNNVFLAGNLLYQKVLLCSSYLL